MVGAYYYSATLGIGRYSFDDKSSITVQTPFSGGTSNNYGIKGFVVVPTSNVTRTEALPEGESVRVLEGVTLNLSGAAASGTVSNAFALTEAGVNFLSEGDLTVSSSVSGQNGSIGIGGRGSVRNEELTWPTVSQTNSVQSVFTESYTLMFPGCTFADVVIGTANMCGNTDGLTGNPYFTKSSEDGKSMSIEYQVKNDSWIKCAKLEFLEEPDGIYGRNAKAYYYSASIGEGVLSVDVEEDRARMANANAGKNTTGTGNGGYGVYSVNAVVTVRCDYRVTNLEPIAEKKHRAGCVATGYSLSDLTELKVTGISGLDTLSVTNSILRSSPAIGGGVDYQYQVATTDGVVKCIIFRLVETAENEIWGYILRACDFNDGDVTLGEDLAMTPSSLEDCNYGITQLGLSFARTTVPDVVKLQCNNCATGGVVSVMDNSRIRIDVPSAIPYAGYLQVGENADVVLGTQTNASARAFSLTIGPGSVVTALGPVFKIGSVQDVRMLSLDASTLRLLDSYEYAWDYGDYFTSVNLSNGAVLSGYPYRVNRNCSMSVSGSGCSYQDAGLQFCIPTGEPGSYVIDVADTTNNEDVDLEFSGIVSVYPDGKYLKGTMVKKGAGTMRQTSRYYCPKPNNQPLSHRLEDGKWIVAANAMWRSDCHTLVLAGGELAVEEGVKGNAVKSLDLQGNAKLTLGDNAYFNLGDSTGLAWTEGAMLRVTCPSSSAVYATPDGLTDAQLKQVLLNGSSCRLGSNGRLVGRGFVVCIR